MSDFISPLFRSPTYNPMHQNKKIILNKRDVNLQFLLATDTGKAYSITYLLNIIPNNREMNPSIPLSPSNINMDSLKKAIMDRVSIFDKNYMIMYSYDTRRVIFHFNHEKWIKEATRDSISITRITRFSRDFKFKKAVPSMIAFDPMRNHFGPFIVRKFKDYMEKGNKGAKWFKHLLPDIARSRMRSRVRNMFDWEYNFQWNTLTATLKPVYILAIIYAVGMLTKNIRKDNIKNINNQKLFATKVYGNLKQFDYGKFDKYSKRKGFM